MSKLTIATLTGATIILAAVLVTTCATKSKKQKKLAVVSDAGYETAFDVYFPLKHNRPGKKTKG